MRKSKNKIKTITMIKNIWSQIDKIQAYIAWISAVLEVFAGWIFAWKPIIEPKNGKYLWFELINNSPKISNDTTGTTIKSALFHFYIVWNNKSVPDVELYEAIDILSNSILTAEKDKIILEDFEIWNISEWNQSWVVKDTNENPYIVAQYTIIYKYKV